MPIAGQPAIAHVIRRLVSQGIHEIAINIHHHAQQLRDTLGNGEQWNANLYYSYESALLNSGGGVRTALELLPSDGQVVVHNADILANIDLYTLAQLNTQQGCALALVPNPKHNTKGDFCLEKHRVTQGNNIYTFSGVSIWNKQVLRDYPSNTSFPLTVPIQSMIQQQRCVGTVYRGLWFDIGRHRDLVQANRLFNPDYS